MKRIVIGLATVATLVFLAIGASSASSKGDCCPTGPCCPNGACCRNLSK